MEKDAKKETLGVSVTRDKDFSKWYLDVVRKGEFKDQRTPIKGFDVIMPWGYAVWERIQSSFDEIMKRHGIKNAYFPLLIPSGFIHKEKEHFKGFEAEAATVTKVGKTELEEELYVRPTSETIMYKMFSLWLRSHKDLPLKINQWCNVVRWDTKGTKPFIRDREFLWQELHTAHATEEDGLREIDEIVEMVEDMNKIFAMHSLLLKRTQNDTFPGAVFSVAFDTLVQDGRVFQGPGGHFLGQNFAKVFDIKFMDDKGKAHYTYQTCLGTSTRQLGGIIMVHGDDKGAVLPPAVSPVQVVIIPIVFKEEEKKIKDAAKAAAKNLEKLGVRTHLDDRSYSAGFKFNEWELKGVPLRIEIGPKDLEAKEMTVVRRLDGKKLKISDVTEVPKILDAVQKEMYEKSKKFLESNIKDAVSMDELKKIKFGISRTNWCGSGECEDWVKDQTGGAEIRGTLYGKKETPFGNCVYCGKKASHVVYVAKAY